MKIPYLRRFLAGFLVVVMAVSMFPVVSAEETVPPCELCGAAEGHTETCDRYQPPVPTGTDPAPTQTNPVPTGTAPVPTGTTPVPTGTAPVPTGTAPVPTGTAPVPTGTAPVPTGTAPVPTGTTPVPTGSDPVPTQTDPVPDKKGISAYEQLLKCETLEQMEEVLLGKNRSNTLAEITLKQWQVLRRKAEQLYEAMEQPSEADTARKDSLLVFMDAQIGQFCADCGVKGDAHLDTCSLKPTEPEATDPKATEPEATDPEATDPEATDPEATDPEATDPEATDPEATDPEATDPEATDPEATDPEATDPEATDPEATDPEATEAGATKPGLNNLLGTGLTGPAILGSMAPTDKLLAFAPAPKAATPTITAEVYTDYNPSTGEFSGKVADLTEAGIKLEGANSWNFGEVRYFKVGFSGFDPSATSTITIELDRILWFEALPKGNDEFISVTATKNPAISLNPSGSYVHDNSYNVTLSITGVDAGSFFFSLKYDKILWRRQANQSLRTDTSKPILNIAMKSGGVTSSLCIIDVMSKNAFTPNGCYRNTVKFYRSVGNKMEQIGYDNTLPFGSVSGLMEDTLILELRAYYGIAGEDNYACFFDELRVELEMPKCETPGYEDYYMSIVKLDNVGQPFAYEQTYDEEAHKYIFTYKNILLNQYIFGRIYIKFPNIPNLPRGDYDFVGKLRMYNGPVEMVQANGYTEFTLRLDNDAAPEIEAYAISKEIGNNPPEDAVSYLGGYSLKNVGNKDSEGVTVKYTFNDSGTALMGVTTLHLMPDPNQRPMHIKYTLMDSDGNVIDNNGQPFETTVSHKYTQYTTGKSVLFNRAMLPDPAHQKLFFKTIEYSIGYIPLSFAYNLSSGVPQGSTSPGNYYGYFLGDTARGTSNTLCQTFNADQTENTGLQETISTTMNSGPSVQVYIDECVLSSSQVDAGEAWTMKLTARVDSYPRGRSTYADQLRFGILLPSSVVINESSAKASFSTGEEAQIASISKTSAGNGQNFWVVKMAEGQPIGYYSESAGAIPNGPTMNLSLQVSTSVAAPQATISMDNSLFVAAKGATGASIIRTDTYDLNEDGKTTDLVGKVGGNAAGKSITIMPLQATLAGGASLQTALESGTAVDIFSETDVVTYSLSIENNRGGVARDLAYYIQIPGESLGGSNDKIVLNSACTVNNIIGTEVKMMYTEESVDYDTVRDNPNAVTWKEESEIADFRNVTMVKIVTKNGEALANGTKVSVAIPLKFNGTSYMACAGSQATINNLAKYTYDQGSRVFSYVIMSQSSTITLKHIEELKEFTLTAALYGEPKEEGNTKTYTFNTGLSFFNEQTFKITDVALKDMDLGDYDKTALNEDANRRFKIQIDMNGSTKKAIVSDAEVGTLAENSNLTFNFELFNGDALTDVTTQRYVTFNISSDSVTIPVRINIKRELATAAPTVSAIKAGKEYVNAGEGKTATISQNSAFTVQFVTAGLSGALYDQRYLRFTEALPVGTTITLMDYTFGTPRYAYYNVTTAIKDIELKDFTMMSGSDNYSYNTGTDSEQFTEKLLFIVDFSRASSYLSGTWEVDMLIRGNDVPDKTSSDGGNNITFTVAGERGFSGTYDNVERNYGESFDYTYSVGSANTDSKYDGCNVVLTVQGAGLPSDAYLLVDGAAVRQDIHHQFVLPLRGAQTPGGGTLKIELKAESLENKLQGCDLVAQLWITGLTDGQSNGRVKVGKPLTVSYKAVTPPSLKIAAMSDRALAQDELANTVTISYETSDIPADATVTLEVQKLVDLGYVTDSTYLESLSSGSGSAGVYPVPANGGSLTMKFSQTAMETGNYQVLMKVKQAGATLLEVPYRFVVTD